MNFKNELVKAIIETFKLTDNIFIAGQVETAVEGIDQSEYTEFFKQLCGEGFEYKNALDRVEIVSKRFKTKDEQILLEGIDREAERLGNSLLAKSNACLDFCHKHRDKYPTDRDFFMNVKYETMTKLDGGLYFDEKETHVIRSLGQEFFMNISMMDNFKKVVDKIEGVLAKDKLGEPSQELIDANVKKMIKQ